MVPTANLFGFARELFGVVAIPSKSGQWFPLPYYGYARQDKKVVAIPSKSGQWFPPYADSYSWQNITMSQSLLNQVNGSHNGKKCRNKFEFDVAIPSKSGQWFPLLRIHAYG